jgi:3-oxoacyl-[acyl-carrier protein] reductase
MTPVAIVSGAEQGLGQTLALHLLHAGYDVRNLPGEVCREGKWAIEHHLDGLNIHINDLKVVINNFGINHLSWIGETPEEDEAIVNVNVMAPYWVINHLVRRLYIARVINVASQTYRVPQRTTALYCASKAALVQLTRVMARELAPKGWIINAIAPGKIMGTEMQQLTDEQVLTLRGWTEKEAERYAEGLVPAGRFTYRAEVATAIMDMLKLPDYVNGTVIDMTGGA